MADRPSPKAIQAAARVLLEQARPYNDVSDFEAVREVGEWLRSLPEVAAIPSEALLKVVEVLDYCADHPEGTAIELDPEVVPMFRAVAASLRLVPSREACQEAGSLLDSCWADTATYTPEQQKHYGEARDFLWSLYGIRHPLESKVESSVVTVESHHVTPMTINPPVRDFHAPTAPKEDHDE